jgi:peptide/nickel transport system ATP-binding protein
MNPLVIVKDLSKVYDLRSSFIDSLFSREQRYLKAVDRISFNIMPGETFGLVGESGCGKTTTGRLIVQTVRATSGQVFFEGIDLSTVKDRQSLKKLALKMQMIFQDPYEYLSPWLNVRDTLAEPLRIHKLVAEDQIEYKVIEVMETVGLIPADMLLPKYTFQLSGGQRQRVGIARALMVNPTFLFADEPVSMLDVSIRVGVLNLLKELRNKLNLTCLFVTHDIAVSRYMSDRIAVMYLGKIVEMGPTENIISDPQHPYTQALIAAVPVPDPTIETEEIPIKGRIPSSGVNLPPGCRFSPRCPYRNKLCDTEEPELTEIGKDRFVMCHKVIKK